MATYALKLLGPPRLDVDGTEIHIGRRKALALLAYLAVTGRAHSRDHLATLLCPEVDTTKARAELRRDLFEINRRFGSAVIAADRNTAQLDPDLNLSLDVTDFRRCLENCLPHPHGANTACAECLPHLGRAIDLYRDHFMAGFTLKDSAAFDDWQTLQTASLKDAMMCVLARLATYCASQGDLEQAIEHTRHRLAIDPLCEAAHRHLILLYARSDRRTAALRQYETCYTVLEAELGVPPSERTQEVYQQLLLGEPAVQAAARETMLDRKPRPVGPCPYRGLAAFREIDAPVFFGREAFVNRLVETMATSPPLTAIVGPSGSGKSSVVAAGLLPRLRQTGTWRILTCRPSSRPFQALANTLIPALEPDLSETARLLEQRHLADALTDGTLALRNVITRIHDKTPGHPQLLLVIDQFEELYTLHPDPNTRHSFIDALLEASMDVPLARYRDAHLSLLLTLRADFMGQALAHRPLADALQPAILLLGPMTHDEFCAAIEKPAATQGAVFEAGLVERLTDDVVGAPGSLPLLEFTLTLLWGHLDFGWLTHAAYEAIDQVKGSLARYAQEEYEALTAADRALARRIFAQLVQPGHGTEDTRRVAAREDLATPKGEIDAAWDLVQHLADRRLVVTGRDPTTDVETVEVVHEALIQHWDQLQAWMAEDRTFRTWQERLRVSLRTWVDTGRDEGALLRGIPLAEAEEWLNTRPHDLGDAERAFVEAGIALRACQIAEREAQRLAELAAAQQLAAAHAQALHQAAIGLAAEAKNKMQGPYQDLAVLLALEAVEHYPYTWQAELALADIVLSWRLVKQIVEAALDSPQQISPDGLTLLCPGNDGVLRTWDLASARNVLTVRAYEGAQGTYMGAQWSPSGDRILSSPSGGANPRVWDAISGRLLAECDDNAGGTAVWSPDGERILTLWSSQSVAVWDAQTGALLYTLPGNESAGAFLSPNGNWIATSLGQIWDAHTGEFCHVLQGIQPSVKNRDHWCSYHWSPDGALVGAGLSGTAWVWDAATGAVVLTLPTGYAGHADVWWSPDGAQLLTTGHSGDNSPAVIWDARTGERLRELPYYDELRNQLDPWSPTGDRILLGGERGIVTVWEARSGRELVHIAAHRERAHAAWLTDGSGFVTTGRADIHTRIWRISTATFTLDCRPDCPLDTWQGFNAAIWSPDGTRLARPFDDGSVRVWDVASRAEVTRIRRSRNTNGAAVNYVTWSPDGRRILTGAGDGGVEIWDSFSGTRLLALTGHGDTALDRVFTLNHVVMGLAWSPDGQRALSCGRDHRAVIWDTVTGEALTVFTGQEFYWGAWSPDGSRIVLVDFFSYSGSVRIWDSATGNALLTLLPDDFAYGTSAVAWSPDGTKIVTFSQDKVGRLWNTETGELVGTFAAETWSFVAQWSPSGDRFLVGGSPGIRVWDAATLQQVVSYPAGTHVSTGSWSPDGKFIAVGYPNGDTKVYPAWQSLEELITYAKEHCVLRELTPEERVQFGLPEENEKSHD